MSIISAYIFKYDEVEKKYKTISTYEADYVSVETQTNVNNILTNIQKGFSQKVIEDKEKNMLYSYKSDSNYVILCVGHDVKQRTIGTCIASISDAISNNHETRYTTNVLKQKVSYYNDPNNDKISLIQSDIEDVKGVMVVNIDNLLERGDKIDTLQTKSTMLSEQAGEFSSRATNLKRIMWWRNAKIWFVVGIVSIFVTVFIILVIKNSGKS